MNVDTWKLKELFVCCFPQSKSSRNNSPLVSALRTSTRSTRRTKKLEEEGEGNLASSESLASSISAQPTFSSAVVSFSSDFHPPTMEKTFSGRLVKFDTDSHDSAPAPTRKVSTATTALVSTTTDSDSVFPSFLGRRSTGEKKPRSSNSNRLSLRRVSFGKTVERPNFIPTTDEMVRLETVVQSEKGRHHLIQGLLSCNGDYVVKIRFMHAVEQYDACPIDTPEAKEKKLSLAQAILDTFLREGSMFSIKLSEARSAFILDGHLDHLLEAKREILMELSNIPHVMTIVDHVEGLDGV